MWISLSFLIFTPEAQKNKHPLFPNPIIDPSIIFVLFPIIEFFNNYIATNIAIFPILTSCSIIVLCPIEQFLPILTFLPKNTFLPNFEFRIFFYL